MNELTAEAWEQRYQEQRDPWDLGHPAPPFVSLLSSANAPQPGKVAVLGAGAGHDALLLAASGFEVTGFDFAPTAIARATANAQAKQLSAQFLQRNIFDLATEFPSSFDYILEHTCFCALDPQLRPQYVQLATKILRPKAQLIALFFTHQRVGGPPFGIQPPEIKELFSPYFDFVRFEIAQDSILRRQGEEHLAILQLKS